MTIEQHGLTQLLTEYEWLCDPAEGFDWPTAHDLAPVIEPCRSSFSLNRNFPIRTQMTPSLRS